MPNFATDQGEPGCPQVVEFQSFDYNPGGEEGASEAEILQQASQILAEAQMQAQDIERRAYEQGFQQGQKDGREVGERSLAEGVQRLTRLVAGLIEERAHLYQQREADLLQLVTIICERVLARELHLGPEAICAIVERGFKYLSEYENLKLVVHPQDYDILKQADLRGWPAGVSLAVDGTLTPGGFRLETPSGDLDGCLEQHKSRLFQVIHEALETSQGNLSEDDYSLED